MPSFLNNLKCAVSNTPGTGSALTISTAASGYRTLGAAQDGLTFDGMRFTDGTAWEERDGCVYTHSGTSLSRGTLIDSSTGSAISLTSATVVSQVMTAGRQAVIEALLQGTTPGGRLTLTTAVPVTTSDVTGATSIYYTPYLSNVIVLWDGARWVPTTFSEQTLAVGTVTSGLPYDVFGYLSSAVLAVEKLAWTNGTTRATGISLQDGRYCKTGDKTRLYLGTFYSTSTTTTADAAGGTTTQVGGKRFLWNMYNRVPRAMAVIDTTDSWTLAAGTSYRQANGAAGNKVEFICGLGGDSFEASLGAGISYNANGVSGSPGIGINSTTTNSAQQAGKWYGTHSTGTITWVFPLLAMYSGVQATGYTAVNWLENTTDSSATVTFEGDGGASLAGGRQSGLNAMVMA